MKVQIVDAADNLIGVKPRAQLNPLQDIYRVAALWITNSQGQVLLAQRSLDNDNGAGEWGPAVAGTIEDGETYESNIMKEAAEEIGLQGITFSLGPKQKISTDRNYFCQWFLVSVDKPATSFTLQPDEVAAVTWVDESDLLRDTEARPSKYIPGMAATVKLFASRKI